MNREDQFLNRDEIIRMARESGLGDTGVREGFIFFQPGTNGLERFAALVAAKASAASASVEREACAKVCDVLADDYGKAGLPMTYQALTATAKEIRARGQQELAEASVEPVARCMEHGECFGGECIYTSPPNVPTARASKPWVQATTWRGLTDEERNWLRKRNQKHDDYAKAVEALLKEKNQ